MSASQEKKRRQQARDEGTDKKQAALQKEADKRKKTRRNTWIIGTIVVVVIIALIVLNSNLFYNVLPAVSIGEESYTAAEYNYFFRASYYSFVNQWGDYVSMFGLDTAQPLNTQYYDEENGITFADYFSDSALASMEQMTMLVNAAKAEGFTLPEEDRVQMEESYASLLSMYADYGYSSFDQYLTANYGKGMTPEILKNMLELNFLASAYATHKSESFQYTDDELEAYYAEHKDEYDKLTYRAYFVSGAADEEAGIDEETAMAAAKEKAEAIASASSEEEFIALVYDAVPEDSKETYEDPDYTLSTAAGSSLSAVYSEWLLDGSRAEGDTTAVEDTSGYYALYYISRDGNHYNVRNVRHILIKAEADKDGEYTDEAKAAALERAESLYAEWQEGGATEDSFAELANLNSEDTGSNTNGGLYESVGKGQMIETFNDWLFDESRVPGDSGIVLGERSDYYGYHIMYYVGEGGLYSAVTAESAMRDADYTAWLEAALAPYDAMTGFAFFAALKS